MQLVDPPAATIWKPSLANVPLMDLLRRIDGDLDSLRRSRKLEQALHRWGAQREALRPYADADALIKFMRDPEASPRQAKNAVLAALCIESTQGDQTASTLLLWLMLPGLLRARRRLVAWNSLARDDLDAELITGVWEAATAVGPATMGVAARLVNRARRRGLLAARRASDWNGRCEPLPADIEQEPQVSDSNVIADILSNAVRLGVISAEDADLLCTNRQTIGEVRERLGLTLVAAQMRRHRARYRLLEWLAGPSVGAPFSRSSRSPD